MSDARPGDQRYRSDEIRTRSGESIVNPLDGVPEILPCRRTMIGTAKMRDAVDPVDCRTVMLSLYCPGDEGFGLTAANALQAPSDQTRKE